MFNINQKKYKKISKIKEVLKKATVSSTNYKSSEYAFFSKNPENKFTLNFKSINTDIMPKGLNNNIINIYKILGNPDKEIYLGNWTIMSLNEALNKYNIYCKNGQTKVFDIGYIYKGMGHIMVISCDLDSHLLFLRPDGGSNGYDREHNYNNLIKNGSSNYKQVRFSNWFFNIILN